MAPITDLQIRKKAFWDTCDKFLNACLPTARPALAETDPHLLAHALQLNLEVSILHVPCVLVFQSEPHVPLVVEVLPWETPAQLIRFAPPHMGLVGAESCWINGYQADCRHRLPPDTDWVELRVTPLTANEATLCAAAFARLPRDAEPRLPRSWTAAGYFPKHGFPAGVFADVPDPTAAEFLPCLAPDIPSSSSSEAYFSSSHSGSPDCARASFPTRPSHPPHSTRQPTRRTMGPLQGSTTAQASTANMHAWRNFTPTTPPIPGPQRRWGRHGVPRELGDIAIALDAGEAEMTVFDPVLHVRVILGDRLAIGTDPVQFALAKSPYLPAGFAGRILRYPVEGYPGPQVVLFASEADGFRTAPVDLQGDSRRICTLAFPAHASVFELTLQLTEHCQAPSTLRFQVARRHAPVEVNGLRAPQFEADTLVDADVVQIRNIRQHWTPRGRPDLLALQESLGTVTPELLLPLRVRRSFTHPVCSVVVHRVGLPHQCVSYDPCMRPAIFRAHVLEALDSPPGSLLKVPLLSPHFADPRPHVLVLDADNLACRKSWALFDVRRLHVPGGASFFLAPLPPRINVDFAIRLVHERMPCTGPMAGVFHNHSWMTEELRSSGTVSLLTIVPQGANILDTPPAVYYTLDLLESNLGYQSAFCRYDEAPRAQSFLRGPRSPTTSTTTCMPCYFGAERAINPDPVHEGPSRRDPRDHVICVVASPQCPPGAFTFHESIDIPELPARALYYVAQHSFVPKLPMIRFSPVVYHTLARISMLFVTVSAEHEPRAYIWIDPLPWIRYPQFRPVDSRATLAEVLALVGLEPAAPMLATVNGQFWAGESRSFSFGDVVQVRDRVIALTTLSLDSWRFSLAHSALLHRPVFGPEMRCHANDLQMLPATAYRQFTREVLYTHFRRIYTAWARELILLPGSAVMFVGPGLPPVRFSSGTHGQPSLDVAQELYNSLFGHRFGCRTVLSMDMRENDAWLFAAVPPEDPTVTWVYGISQGLSFVHTDRSGTHLQHHPIMERTVLLPSITFGSVGVAVHTFDNRVRPVLQRRTLRGPTTGRGLPAATPGLSLLQLSVRHERVLRSGPGASTRMKPLPMHSFRLRHQLTCLLSGNLGPTDSGRISLIPRSQLRCRILSWRWVRFLAPGRSATP